MTSSFLALSQGEKRATLSNYQLVPDLGASDPYACSGMDKATIWTICWTRLQSGQSALLCFLDPGGDCIPQASSWQATWPLFRQGLMSNSATSTSCTWGKKDLTWTLTLLPFLGWHDQGQGHLRGWGWQNHWQSGLLKPCGAGPPTHLQHLL